MDTTKSKNYIITHPAYLFIGNHELLVDKTIGYLQNYFCANSSDDQGCQVCIPCRKVRDLQHELITWFNPDKQYTVADIQPLFATIAYTLESNSHHFFILQHAHTLGSSCSNALLKSLEEPPAGYHFILLATRSDAILPTIKSRCLSIAIGQENQDNHGPLASLFAYFTTVKFQDPAAFLKELDQANPHEGECIDLLDRLMIHWSTHYKKAIAAGKPAHESEKVCTLLQQTLAQTPMAGGSKLFLKNLFLKIKSV